MMRLGIIATVIGCGLLLLAQDTKTDYDHSFNFSGVHTFAVKIGTPWGNQLSEQRAIDAVTKQLTAKGWAPADPATADAQVVIHGASQTKKSLDTFYSGGWGGYGWGGFGGVPGNSTTTVQEYQVGTMVVDIFSTKDKKLIFRGTAQDELSNKPEKNTKKIDKGAEKMFKNFPPGQPEEK